MIDRNTVGITQREQACRSIRNSSDDADVNESAGQRALMDPPLSRTMEQLADELGASDIFVFRRVTSSRFVHVGGAGRGKTWTAPLEVDVEIDLFGVRLRVGQPLWMRYREPQRIFGPYHAASAVAVQLNQDALVVFGATTAQPSGSGPTTATLIEAAERAVEWSENLTRQASGRGAGDRPRA